MSSTLFDYVLNWGKIAATSIGKAGGVLTQIVGIGGLDPDDADDTSGEVGDDSPMFGAPIVARPLPPEVIDGLSVHAEVICARTADGLVPIAWRDIRLDQIFPGGVKEGSTALASYGGGFFGFNMTEATVGSKKGSIATCYVPYEFDGDGVPTKAHAIIVDSEDESISILHGEGLAILLQNDRSITMQTDDGQTVFRLEDGKITLQAAQIVLNGGAVVVGNPLGPIVPLTAGPASPPCPRLFLNPAT